MINFNSLQSSLDRSVTQASNKMDDAAIEAADSGSPEDVQAFGAATQDMATATILMNQAQRASHGLTKAIIDGIQ